MEWDNPSTVASKETKLDDEELLMITTTGPGAYCQGKNINIHILSLFDQM